MNKYVIGGVALIATTVLAGSIPAFAETNGPAKDPINQQTSTSTPRFDGLMRGPGVGFGKGLDKKEFEKTGKMGTSTNPLITGNGQPVIAGIISTIGSSTISITNKSNVVYTVDTTNAKILQGKNIITISALKTGDTVIVQGTINGTSVTASSIIDQTKPANPGKDAGKKPHPGFFGGIGQFFMHLFGF